MGYMYKGVTAIVWIVVCQWLLIMIEYVVLIWN